MSTIYDALKKVSVKQHGLKKSSSGNRSTQRKIKISKLFYIFAFFAIFALLALFVDIPSSEKTFIDKSYISDSKSRQRYLEFNPGKEVLLPPKIKLLKVDPAENPDTIVSELPEFYLNGIFFSQKRPAVLINGKMLKAGDLFQGVLIEKIESESVQIKFKNSTFLLSYPE